MIDLLILTPYIPYPINSGGNQVFFQLVDRLRMYANISIVMPVTKADLGTMDEIKLLWKNVKFYFYDSRFEEKSEIEQTFSYKFLRKIRASADRKLQRRLKKLDSEDLIRSNSILKFSSSELKKGYIDMVYEIVHTNKFDLIQVDFFGLIDIVNILPDDIKKVFINHEIRYVRAEQELNLLQYPKPIDYFQFNSIKKYEIENLNAYDAIVTLTDVDNKKLADILRKDIIIQTSPVIVETKNEAVSDLFQFQNKLIYLGGYSHTPNLDGVDWFLTNCWNDIRKVKPEIELHIIGKWSPKYEKYYTDEYENVMFKGFVENLSYEFSGALMIVPLRIGSGIRIKILDAINKGVPIISTSIGAEGIGLENGKDCFIADDRESFINAILTLTNDNNLCDNFRTNARGKLEKRGNPNQLALRRLNIYEDLLGLLNTQNNLI